MRVEHILPESFGRSLPLLNIPPADFVVIFGPNESGKSTYLDLLISLLSNKTDLITLLRHGRERDQIKGEIRLVRGDENIRVEFGKLAHIGAKSVDTKRIVNNSESLLWDLIKNLDANEIRNIYRVDAIEILASVEKNTGERIETIKAKFKSYASGDRRGVDITGLIDKYRKSAESNLSSASRSKTGLNESRILLRATEGKIREAETKSSKSKNIQKHETVKMGQVEELKRNLDEFNLKLQALDHAHSISEDYSQLETNEGELNRLSATGLLHPEKLGQISMTLDIQSSELQSLLDNSQESNSISIRKEIAEKTLIVTDLERNVGFDNSNLDQINNLIGYQNRESEFAQLVTLIGQRDSCDKLVTQLNIAELRSRLAGCISEVNELEQKWNRLGIRNQANEPMDADEFFMHNPIVSSPSAFSPQSINTVSEFAILAIAAIGIFFVTFSSGRSWSAVISGLTAIALSGFAIKALRHRHSGAIFKPNESTIDDEKPRKLALKLVTQRDNRGQLITEIATKNESVKNAETDRETAVNNIHLILVKWGLPESPELTTGEATEIKTSIDNFVNELNLLRKLESSLNSMTEHLQIELRSFRAISESVKKLLGDIGLKVDLVHEGGLKSAAPRLSQILKEFEHQEKLRVSVQDAKKRLDLLPKNLKPIVFSQLEMSVAERESLRQSCENSSEQIDAELITLQDEVNGLIAERKVIEGSLELPQLREEQASKQDVIRELELDIALARVQASILERLSTARNISALPQLENRIKKIALAAAPDWRDVRFDLEKNTFYVLQSNGKEIRDNELSSGALSLLFMAIRLAIIQEEDSKENALKIPLLCDDPLLHLDEERTKSTFKMMVNESKGRQTLYFTCRPDILELAASLSLPILKI